MVQMETDSPVVYHGTSESRFPPEVNKTQLTKEDIRVLRECNKESFYYRCLPFAFAGMTATYLLFKKGILTGHPKFGPAGKMTAAAFSGWFLGKASYRSKCEEKFLAVENSSIGDMVRRKKGITLERFGSESVPLSVVEDSTSKEGYTSYSGGDYHSSSGSLNFDQNIPYAELEDRNRPSLDTDGRNNSEDSMTSKNSTTYEELRMKNREEYEKQFRQTELPKSETYRRPWNPTSYDTHKRTGIDSQNTPPKNAYGDSWDNPKFS